MSQFSHQATVLPVDDVESAMEYYHRQLGFEITMEWGDPVEHVAVKRGGVVFFLVRSTYEQVSKGKHAAAYVFIADVDSYYNECMDKEVNISTEIGDREYGMRDFDVVDPSGHMISFGTGLELLNR